MDERDVGGSSSIAQSSCDFTNRVWYTLNFTINDAFQAVGWLKGPGIFCQVQATFPSNEGTATGTGFGLKAGGSALFDNVAVSTVDSFITGTGFSNSFYQNGAPGTNVHMSAAGMAQLQNGAGSPSEEQYYGYTAWGGLSQAKRLFTSGGTQWLSSSRTYDSYGNLLTIIDPAGNSTNYGYSSSYSSAYLTTASRLLKPGLAQVTTSYAYNFTMGTRTSSLSPNGYNTTYQYDILGRLTKVSYPNSLGFTQYVYNDLASYVNITNENGWKTQQFYDGLGRLSMTKRLMNGTPYSTEAYDYNWQDKIVKKTDAMNNAISYQYDSLGRLTRTTEPNQNSTQVFYNDLGSWVLSADENGVYKCNTYDRLGRLVKVVENSTFTCQPGIFTNYYYDGAGNLVKLTTSTGESTTYTYDNLNRLTQTSYPDQTIEQYRYDTSGNLATKIDRRSLTTQYSYDSLNRIMSISYPGTITASDNYTYDTNSNLIRLDGNNATLLYSYDARNRIISETYQVNSGFVLSLNPSLVSFFCTPTNPCPTNIISKLNVTSFRGFSGTVALAYVQPSSGTGGTSLTGPSSVYLASGASVRLNLTASHGTSSGDYTWTVQGQSGGLTVSTTLTIHEYICTRNCPTFPVRPPTSQSSSSATFSSSSPSRAAAAYTIRYAYSGETQSNTTYPDGLVVKYAYDGLGRIATATAGTTQYASLSYNLNDQVTNTTYGNGLKTLYTYDHLARPLNITVSGSKQLLSLVYSYYKTGTLASVTGKVNGTGVNEQYGYDALQRLTSATITNGNTNSNLWYQYDNAGNRIRQNGVGLTNSSYDLATNELLQTARYFLGRYSTTASYAYDADGNLLSENVTSLAPAAHWKYSWSPQGNLVTVSNYTSIRSQYAYDGLGRRVESIEASTIFYAYLGTETLSEIVSGGTTTDYVSAGGLRIAKVSGTSVSYYHTDALGSTRLTTSSTGTVVFSDNYQPYGSDNTSKGSETYKFTGKPVSQTTGLYYYGARWYDPTIGRFISQDPDPGARSNPQSLNPYIYAFDQPTGITDPSGMDGCWVFSWACNQVSSGATTAWSGLTTAGTDIQNGWNSLSPEEQQGLMLAGFVALTVATGGTDLLVIGAVGAVAATAAYVGTSYAAGNTPTLAGALTYANLGFALTTGVYAFADPAPEIDVAARLAANRGAGLAFESDAADILGFTRNIGAGRTVLQGTETAGRAIPDYVGATFYGEAKFTQGSIYATRQIRIMIEAAGQQGKDLALVYAEGTRIAPTVFRYASEFGVRIIRFPI